MQVRILWVIMISAARSDGFCFEVLVRSLLKTNRNEHDYDGTGFRNVTHSNLHALCKFLHFPIIARRWRRMGRNTALAAAGVNVETPKAGLKMLDASPDLLDPCPNLLDASPDLLGACPDLLDSSPDLLDSSPDLLGPCPDLLGPCPDLLDKRPDLLDKRPDLLDSRPDLLDSRPDLLDKRPDLLDKRPDLLDSCPDLLDSSPDLLDTIADVPFAKIFISLPIYFVSLSFRTSTSVSARGKMAISSMWPTNPRASMRS
jgi:hypothetical protein